MVSIKSLAIPTEGRGERNGYNWSHDCGLIITLLIYLPIALYGFVSFFEDLEHMLSEQAA
jgi:hypothetical protein